MNIIVNNDDCNNCGLCVFSCPYNLITADSDGISIDNNNCDDDRCKECIDSCPINAMEREREDI